MALEKIPSKTQIIRAMTKAGITGTVSGSGQEWEVELPDEAAHEAFQEKVLRVGGYRTGYGGYVLRPGYKEGGDWNDRSSRCHY